MYRIRNKINSLPLTTLAFTPSTLLIPAHRFQFFNMRKKQFHSINQYFMYLLTTYAQSLNEQMFTQKKFSIAWKKQYQNNGLYLKKANFLSDPLSWEKWRQISGYLGLSICNLFVIIMEIDYVSWLSLDKVKEAQLQKFQRRNRNTYHYSSNNKESHQNTFYYIQRINFKKKILTRYVGFI